MNSTFSKNTENIPPELLRKSEQYQNLFKHANDAILIFEPDSEIILDVNDRACEMYGRRREDFIGRSLKEMSQNVIRGTEELGKLLRDGVYEEFESVHLRGDGTPFDLVINASVIEYQGRPAILAINRDVTARKLTQELLKNSEQNYRFLSEGIMHQVWTSQPDGKIDYVNQRTLEYFGLTSEQIIGKGWQNVIHPDDLPLCVQRWTHSLATGEDYEVEFRLKKSDGTYRWHSGCATAGRDADGKIIKWFGTNTDINDKKLAENNVREREKQFRSIVETTNEWMWEIDFEGNYIYNNPAVEKILGYTPEELYGINFLSFMHEADRGKTGKILLTLIAEKRGWTNRVGSWRHKDGSIRYLESNAVPILDARGEVTGFSGADRDITERKRAEEIVRESEARYRVVTESASDAIVTIDLESTILFVNPAAEKMFGYARDEMLDNKLLMLMPERFRAAHTAGIKRYAATGERNIPWRGVEFPALHKDGYEVPVEITFGELNSDGKQLFTAIIRDITERKQSEEKLRNSEQRFRELVDSLPTAVYVCDLSGEIESYNKSAVELWGRAPKCDDAADIFCGSHKIYTVDGVYLPHAECPMAQVLRTGIPISNAEIVIERPDGSRRTVMVNILTRRDEQGNLTGAVNYLTDITERKRAANLLENNLSLLTSTFEATADGIIVVDLKNNPVMFNEKFVEMWRIPKDMAHEKNIAQILDLMFEQLKDSENFKKKVEKSLQQPEAVDFSILKLADGRCYERFSLPQMLEGKVVGRVLSYRDITERKQAEVKLRESEERFRSFMNNNPAVAFMKDEAGRYVYCNETMERVFHIKVENMLGKTDFDWLPENIAGELHVNDEKILASNQTAQMLESVPTADGEIHHWLSIKFPVSDASGKKFIGGVAVDITERERAETALRESEYKLRNLLTSMSEGLLQVDEEDSIVFVNNCFSEMVGYSQEELIGKNWSRLLLDNEGNEFIREVNKRRRKGISDKYELRLKKKSGEALYVLVGGVPILEAKGVVSGSMGVFTDITERKHAEDQLLHDAFHDGLTGLANRALFMDHLRMTLERSKSRHSNSYAVLFLDFDRFKVINDSLGHTEGDNLLKFIARRLESATRTGDLVARLGGDEFVVLLSELVEEDDAILIAERIQASLKNPFNLNGNTVFISASIGIALSAAGHLSAEDMLRDADIAMYRAKAKGKARYQIFDQAMHEHASKQLQLETEMRRALENNDFLLHYQPIVNLETKTLMGFEALVRWKHSERGMIPPFEFIPAAEETGLILPLGNWILEESCRQLRRWQNDYPATSNLTISVNLSSKQFMQPDLAEQIAATLKKTGLDPRCLKLEITESHIMDYTEIAIAMINKLCALGIELSLDDFGTGYSSLSYLHRLPVNYLKIDRSFITRMNDAKENSEIVHTIIKLAQNLKMMVVAEGIETGEQLAHLKILNCEFGQGYFFSKPLESEAAEMFIAKSAKNLASVPNQPTINAEFNM